jgi:hypothetical protein
MEMHGVRDALAAAGGLAMGRYLGTAMTNADSAVSHDHLYALADQPPPPAVAVAIDLEHSPAGAPFSHLVVAPAVLARPRFACGNETSFTRHHIHRNMTRLRLGGGE